MSSYQIPNWACKPPSGTHLDVLKDEKLIQVFGLFTILAGKIYLFFFFLETNVGSKEMLFIWKKQSNK